MPHRQGARRALTLLAAAPALLGADVAPAPLTVKVVALRSGKGQIVACLTARVTTFPDCEKDPRALTRIVRAHDGAVLDFGVVAPGRYAIALFHDENGNGRLDKKLILPSEGYGFSRDAPVRFGPPTFAHAAFTVDGGEQVLTIRMRYIF